MSFPPPPLWRAPTQGCGWGRLQSVGASSDVGIGPLCARWLSLIHTDEFPVPLPPGERLHQMFVVGTRVRPCPPASYPMRPFFFLTMSCAQMQARGIYATLPQPRNTPPTPVSGGHLDGHPFQLGVEAYIDEVEEGGGGL